MEKDMQAGLSALSGQIAGVNALLTALILAMDQPTLDRLAETWSHLKAAAMAEILLAGPREQMDLTLFREVYEAAVASVEQRLRNRPET